MRCDLCKRKYNTSLCFQCNVVLNLYDQARANWSFDQAAEEDRELYYDSF